MLCFHGRPDCPYCFEDVAKAERFCVACARLLIGRERVHCHACRRRGFEALRLKLPVGNVDRG